MGAMPTAGAQGKSDNQRPSCRASHAPTQPSAADLAAEAAVFTRPIRTFGDGRYEPVIDPAPDPALTGWARTLAEHDPLTGRVIDIVAWLPAEPGRWWRRAGVLDVLGLGALALAELDGKPLRLYSTPAAWLGSGDPRGAVILDWTCDPRTVLAAALEVECESGDLARKLRGRIWQCAQTIAVRAA